MGRKPSIGLLPYQSKNYEVSMCPCLFVYFYMKYIYYMGVSDLMILIDVDRDMDIWTFEKIDGKLNALRLGLGLSLSYLFQKFGEKERKKKKKKRGLTLPDRKSEANFFFAARQAQIGAKK